MGISEKSLKAHVFTSHSDRAKKQAMKPKTLVQCPHCEKTYGTKQRLKDHVKQVHTKVTCEICDEVQYNWFYLKRHKASIHGIIPRDAIKCQFCPLIFKSEVSLKKHLAAKHASTTIFQFYESVEQKLVR